MIQSYTKKQLAQLYKIHPKTLRYYLNIGNLYQILKKAGYDKYQKRLSPLLIKIIFDYLGTP
ncbi:MAG: DUF4248 domain-containing protein [Bacteroidales bacterium]|nr:DUF4248 domain-containing protein [Bacteroidales bacterium]